MTAFVTFHGMNKFYSRQFFGCIMTLLLLYSYGTH